jgi:hypothetical protein
MLNNTALQVFATRQGLATIGMLRTYTATSGWSNMLTCCCVLCLGTHRVTRCLPCYTAAAAAVPAHQHLTPLAAAAPAQAAVPRHQT